MNRIRLIILALSLSSIIMSCTTSRPTATYKYEPKTEQSRSDLLVSKKNKTETGERKILFSAFLTLRVDKPDTANIYIEKIAKNIMAM